VDAVIADEAAVPLPDRLRRAAGAVLSPGGRVHLAPVAAADPDVPRHDPVALAEAIGAVLAGFGRQAAVAAGPAAERT
jgi:hypothetical protein